ILQSITANIVHAILIFPAARAKHKLAFFCLRFRHIPYDSFWFGGKVIAESRESSSIRRQMDGTE
ncbi:MAG TPA: hypothetical protein VMT26_05160, partial [Candidatus Bathyarchaeia archaeon]|nr:hypothetical protein [Candidatus Bathyarchaeia archaeon]